MLQLKTALFNQTIRLNSYKLLSDCYYPPDQKLLDKLANLGESELGICAQIKAYVPKSVALEALAVDFSRLFVGPFKLLAPPYGSVYLDGSGMLMGDSSLDARESYQEEGLDIAVKEVPDHIAIELEFMYLLIFKQMQAIRDLDRQGANEYLKKQCSFLNLHLGRWLPVFAQKVENCAQTKFYQNLARVSNSFIEQELRVLA